VLVRRHRADDSVTKAMTRILRAELIVVDDIGLLPVTSDAAEGLYHLVDAAYEKRSRAISSNLQPPPYAPNTHHVADSSCALPNGSESYARAGKPARSRTPLARR
jgi:hypothetical protein